MSDEAVGWTLKPVDQKTFTGPAFSGLMAGAEADVPAKIYYVRFLPGARTYWHAHAGSQILIVRSGRCLYQRAGHAIAELTAGQSVRFEAGERHWHGAAPTEPAEHIAINLTTGDTTWLEAVTPEEYSSPLGRRGI